MIDALPTDGVPATQILDELRALRDADHPTHGGRLFSYVYDAGMTGLDDLAQSAHALSAHVNGLDPTAFPSLQAGENALVAAAARVLHAGPGTTAPDVVGSVTSGGTESLILAVKTARDAQPAIDRPRIVVPSTGHAAFAKAAHYLRVELDIVDVDPTTARPDPGDMRRAIRDDTVLVACSAPSYAHGVIDPVTDIAAIAAEHGVRCHVDACFGGWVLPYLRRNGVPIPPFGFDVDGVTSVSVDLHKYAYTQKGVSILLHRNAELRLPQYFAYASWPGYTMINPVIASTRSGGPIAAALATLRHIGDNGYLDLARRAHSATATIADAVTSVDGVRLYTPADSTVVCFTADDDTIDVLAVADELASRGWYTQPQLAFAGFPATVHMTVTAAVETEAHHFAGALASAVAAVRAAGPPALPVELMDMARALRPEDVSAELVANLAVQFGLGNPDSTPMMAAVNTLLGLASAPTRERLLVEFMSFLQHPSFD